MEIFIMWDTVKKLLGTAAPLLGTAIGGPAGSIVGTLISSALGVDNTPEAVEQAIKNNPDALVKLKELEFNHKAELEKIALEKAKLEVADTQNYLKDIQDARKNHNDHWMPSVLTFILSFMVAGMFIGLFVYNPPEQFSQVLIMISGTVLGAFSTSVAFWLGSSKGSWLKQQQILDKEDSK